MHRLSDWWAGKPDMSPKAAQEDLALEKDNLQHALLAAAGIMNDDLDGASEELSKRDTVFHELGLALMLFMRSVLGMEKESMTSASNKIADVEAKAWVELKRLQRRGSVKGSSKVYPPGTEMEIIIVQAQLMGAMIGVLHENVVEAVKSFYKLRKAYITLDAILAIETKEVERRKREGNSTSSSQINTPEFTTAQTTPTQMTPASSRQPSPPRSTTSANTIEAELTFDNPIDVFIHSAANMCFGIILLVLGLIPPSFSKVLSIVGFHGDRARGVRMLWKSAAHPNLNGAVAALMLLVFYNGGASDIMPSPEDYDDSAEAVGPPVEKCKALIESMRAQYPASRLWQVQDAVMHSAAGEPEEAIKILAAGEPSKMKQVAAVNNFELALDRMVTQDWANMRDDFLRCLELNDWSPSTYYYMAGCASVELYRDAVAAGDATEAKLHKTKAQSLFDKTPSVIGKKRLMAKQLPLETFLQMRLHRWEERAKDLDVDMVDAIGASPALEMCYMWNGKLKMGEKEKQRALDNLDWSRCTCDAATLDKIKAEPDEMATWAINRAAMLKGLNQNEEARSLLLEHVVEKDKALFKGHNKSDYVMPVALYELAAILWYECCEATDEAAKKEKAIECKELLERSRNWESFVLDGRIGMRTQGSLETIHWYWKKMGWQ